MNKKPVILIVDDDEDFVVQQQIALTNSGYNVLTAYSRKEAEAIASKETIDCAVVDLMMEEMDGGFVLAYHLKNINAKTAVIIVTAVTGETGIDFGSVDSGEKKWIKADAILAKPIRFEQLSREIQRLLS